MPESENVLVVKRGEGGVPDEHEDWTILPEKLLLIPVVKRPQDEDSPLKRWMDAHGVSAAFMASRVGMSRRAVQLWYAGQCIPELAPAFKIAKVTGDHCRERGCHTSCVRADSWLGTRVGRAHWKVLEGAEGKSGRVKRQQLSKTIERTL